MTALANAGCTTRGTSADHAAWWKLREGRFVYSGRSDALELIGTAP